MTPTGAFAYNGDMSHLPDPVYQSEFYANVTLKRGVAWVFDTVLIAVLAFLVSLVTVIGLFFLPVFFFVTGFVYRWVTIGRGSSTWGMRLMSIELRDSAGRRLDGATAFWHTMGYTVSMIFLPLQVISVGLMALTERGQGLTDHVLGTVMINRRA